MEQKSVNEEVNDINENRNFLDLLRQLVEIQSSIAKVEAQIAIRDGKEHIKAKIDSTKGQLEESAKRFGTNLKKIENQYSKNNSEKKSILQQYETCLEMIDEMYDQPLQSILEEKSELESEEQFIMSEQKNVKINRKYVKMEYQKKEAELKSEVKNALDSGDLELAQSKMDELKDYSVNNDYTFLKSYNVELQTRRTELRTLIEQCEKQYEALINEKNSAIDNAIDSKDNYLALIEKQNLFQRFVGSVLNRFNGGKRFIKNCMDPLQVKVVDLRDKKIPQIKETVTQKKEDFFNTIIESKSKIERTVTEKVTDYSSRLAEFQVKTVQNTINLGHTISNKAQDIGTTFVGGVVNAGNAVKNVAVKSRKTLLMTSKHLARTIKDNVNKGISNGKQTYNNIIKKGHEKKLNFINGISNKLEEKREELNIKMENLNPNLKSQESPDIDLDD